MHMTQSEIHEIMKKTPKPCTAQAFLTDISLPERIIRDRDITLQHDWSTKFSFPIKVLQLIIRLAHPVDVSFFSLGSHPNKDRLEIILALSLVSRFWRRAIVNDPTTWSVINLPSPQSKLQEQVSRSGGVPLHIFVHFRLLKHDEDVMRYSIAFNEFRRVKTLKVVNSLGSLRSLESFCFDLLSLVPPCAPMLEVLNLGSYILPDGFKFLPGGAPRLKVLSIPGPAIFSLPLPSFRCLTTLSAYIHRLHSSKALVDILLAAPLLESLSLSYSCFKGDFYHEDSQLVRLLNLKELILIGDQTFFSGLFPLLIIPPNISWQFNISNFTTSNQSLMSFISTIPSEYMQIHMTPFFGALYLSRSYHNPYASSGLSFNRLALSHSTNEGVAFVDRTLSLFDLSGVIDLKLAVPFEAIPHKLATRDIYEALVNLRTLTIRYACHPQEQEVGNFEPTYLGGLMYEVEPKTIPCPFLEKLIIQWPRISWPGYATSLKACVEARRNAGYPFKKVIVQYTMGEITPDVSALLDDFVKWEHCPWNSPVKSF